MRPRFRPLDLRFEFTDPFPQRPDEFLDLGHGESGRDVLGTIPIERDDLDAHDPFGLPRSQGGVLLADDMARARADREEWRKRVERWKGSGLTAKEFAAETGINAGNLQFWQYK